MFTSLVKVRDARFDIGQLHPDLSQFGRVVLGPLAAGQIRAFGPCALLNHSPLPLTIKCQLRLQWRECPIAG